MDQIDKIKYHVEWKKQAQKEIEAQKTKQIPKNKTEHLATLEKNVAKQETDLNNRIAEFNKQTKEEKNSTYETCVCNYEHESEITA